jgi:hypothetical protein
MSLSMWIVSSAMSLLPTGAHVGRIVVAAAAAGLSAWGLKEAGLPTIVWTVAAGVLYALLVVVLGVVKPAELRGLVRRGEA